AEDSCGRLTGAARLRVLKRHEHSSLPDQTAEEAGVSSPLRVCFVALHALPAIDPALQQPVGGTETRAWTFARGLVQTGRCGVSFVVRTNRKRAAFVKEGVGIIPRKDRLYALYESVGRCVERSAGFPG